MTRLRNRIEKLEKIRPTSKNLVWAHVPIDMTDEECRRRADAYVGDYFNGEYYELSMGRAYNVEEFNIYWVGTTEDLDRIMDAIANCRRPPTFGVTYDEPNTCLCSVCSPASEAATGLT